MANSASDVENEKKDVKEHESVISYVKEQQAEVDTEAIHVNVRDTVRAMEGILDVLKNILKVDESIDESIAVMDIAKHLCYKKGVPTLITEEDLIKSSQNVSREKIMEIIDRLMHADLLRKVEKDGEVIYHLTPKADALGEAMYHMFIWALQWSK